MRADDIGLFWEDLPTERVRGKVVEGPMPEIPVTGWKAPTTFPNLTAARCIAVDVETYDPELEEHGPGWGRGCGHVVGVSLAVDGKAWYFPVRHETCPEENLDAKQVFAYLRNTLGNPNQPKVGANLMYDIGWLKQENIVVRGELVDVQFAEALLQTNAQVALDVLGHKYVGEGKVSEIMYKWLGDWFPGTAKGKLRKHIYRAPPSLVGAYAESDADLPLKIAKMQYPLLLHENMLDLFRMECKLIPLLVEMRMQGVPVHVNKAEETREALIKQEAEAQGRLNRLAGMEVLPAYKDTMVAAFDKAGLPYLYTKPSKTHPAGQPSFTKTFLDGLTHPLGQAINEVRKINKLRTTFIEGHILGSHVNGRIYSSLHPLKGESGGSGYGRFASSKPNLQQIPSRDKQWAKVIRGIFVPDENHVAWRKYDYSQIEYRLLAHFAYGSHAYMIQQAYLDNPRTDFHKQTGDRVESVTGQVLENRSMIKGINFGMCYGMGLKKLMKQLGIDPAAAALFIDSYNEANPYVKETFDHCKDQAADYGFISTILGRKARFDLWEPRGYKNRFHDNGQPKIALPYQEALQEYGSIDRSMVHKALNNRLQGSSADQIKAAMVQCYEDGVFDATGVPLLQVHDELDFQDRGTKESDEAFVEMQHIMETCVPLAVPVIVDCEIGPNWGNVTETLGSFTSIGRRNNEHRTYH